LALEVKSLASEDKTTGARRLYAQAPDFPVIHCCIPRPQLSKNLISIVENEQIVREALEALIRSLGYNVAAFASALEYLRSDRARDTACLITDLQMPGMSGADLHARLIADDHYIPVIFVTADYDEEFRRRALNAGAFEALSKPVNERRLIECLERAVKSPG
jgi:FixJ family two-component response regulator